MKPYRTAILTCLALVVLTAAAASLTAEEAAEAASGKELFLANKCNLCHAIAAEEIERKTKSDKLAGPDLDGVGSKHSTEWIVGFLLREELLNDKKHKKEYKGTAEDAAAIAAWLQEMKAAQDAGEAAGR